MHFKCHFLLANVLSLTIVETRTRTFPINALLLRESNNFLENEWILNRNSLSIEEKLIKYCEKKSYPSFFCIALLKRMFQNSSNFSQSDKYDIFDISPSSEGEGTSYNISMEARFRSFRSQCKLTLFPKQNMKSILFGIRIYEMYNVKDILFEYDLMEVLLPLQEHVMYFCEEENLLDSDCINLFNAVLERLENLIPNGFNYYMLPLREGYVSHTEMFAALYTPTLRNEVTNESIVLLEQKFDDLIYNYYQSHEQSYSTLEEICFIHSVGTINDTDIVLPIFLSSLSNSSLMFRMSLVVVLLYGAIDITVLDELQISYPTVLFLHRTNNTANYEVPTLRHIHHFVQRRHRDNSNKAHILFLRSPTTASDILNTQELNVDWQRLVLSFLIDRYSSSYYLLLSEEIDVTGCSVLLKEDLSGTSRSVFLGNMWWTTSSYVSTLGEPARTSDPTVAESWVISGGRRIRAFDLHSAFGVNLIMDGNPTVEYLNATQCSTKDAYSCVVTGNGNIL